VGYIPSNFLGETVKFKAWIQRRLAWLDVHMPGDEFGSVYADHPPVAIFRMFPNPANEWVYIESDNLIGRIEILTISGNRVFQNSGGPEFSAAVDIHPFPPGIYLVHITTVTGESRVEKLVIH
jgi:hypothetical protein